MHNHQITHAIRALLLLVILAGLFSGCANEPRSSDRLSSVLADMSLQLGEPVDGIFQYRIDSWRYVDQDQVIIEARRKEYYLVKFHSPCFGLSASSDLGFTATTSSLTKFDKIIVENFNDERETCTIRSIHQLDATEDADGEKAVD